MITVYVTNRATQFQAVQSPLAFPTVVGQSGKYLTNNGSVLSWGAVVAPAWGAITGTLSNQTDLQNALNGKAAVSHTHGLSGLILGGVVGQVLVSGAAGAATLFAPGANEIIYAGTAGILASSPNITWTNSTRLLDITGLGNAATYHVLNIRDSTGQIVFWVDDFGQVFIRPGAEMGISSYNTKLVSNGLVAYSTLFIYGDGVGAGESGHGKIFGGNVSISISGASFADDKSILDLQSTTRGFLPPRMTGAQRDAISTPPNGLVVFNTTTSKLSVREAGIWVDK